MRESLFLQILHHQVDVLCVVQGAEAADGVRMADELMYFVLFYELAKTRLTLNCLSFEDEDAGCGLEKAKENLRLSVFAYFFEKEELYLLPFSSSRSQHLQFDSHV